MKILFIGDIVGDSGRETISLLLPGLIEEKNIEFVVANGENIAGGSGITSATADVLLNKGVDVITSGDHIWRRKEIYKLINEDNRILRPANYPPGVPGAGTGVYLSKNKNKIGVINLQGRVFMKELDCPFRVASKEIKILKENANIILIDIHAEATSEKIALGIYLDGMVSAVVGTHTHVQTADEKILPQKTAYITDIGMTGAHDSVLGREKDKVVEKFLTNMPVRLPVAKNDMKIQGVIVEINETSGLANSIERISIGV